MPAYYIDTNDFTTATSIWVDSNLTVKAADGFYQKDGVYRQMSGGELLPSTICSDCPTPPAPTCPDRRVVFQICNSNSAKDDNFDIYLNDVYIGAVDLSQNAQVGSVFIADLNTSIQVLEPDFICPLAGMVTYHFDPSILLSVNTLEMRNTQNNNNGNFGTIGIRNYLLDGTDLISPCVITNLEYSGGSGLNFTFNFNYTECCQPAWYRLINCNDSSIAYSQEYVSGDFEINERVTTTDQTWIIAEELLTQPTGDLYLITATGFINCPPEINVISVGGYMEPCTGGAIDDYMGAVVSLDSVVDVDTTFVVEVYYVETGGTCGGTQFFETLNVVVPNGSDLSNFNACADGVNFPSGAVICSACIVSCDNPNVLIGAFECPS